VIDFAVRETGPASATPPEAAVHCGENAVVSDTQIFRNSFSESWRVIFSLKPKAGNKDSVDIQCALKRGAATLTETWIYHWSPPLTKMKAE
jgi:glucan biosynthesis protein